MAEKADNAPVKETPKPSKATLEGILAGKIVLPGDKIMGLRFMFEGSETIFYLDETKPGAFLLRVWKFGA